MRTSVPVSSILPVAIVLLVSSCGSDSPTDPDQPVQLTLSIQLTGDGAGTVTSDPAGIDCTTEGGTCSASFERGTTVTLSAAPATADDAFEGWDGACAGTGACAITMNSAAGVTAAFDDVTVTTRAIGASGGTVMSPDGALELVFPAGAVSSEQQITVRRLPPESLDPELIDPAGVIDAFDLGPDGLEFAEPVEARLRIAVPDQPEPKGVAFPFLFSISGGALEPLGGTFEEADDPSEAIVTGQLEHFSFVVHSNGGGLRFVFRAPDMAVVGEPFLVRVRGTVYLDFPSMLSPSSSAFVTEASAGPLQPEFTGARQLDRSTTEPGTSVTYSGDFFYTCTAPGEAQIELQLEVDLPGESVFGIATFTLGAPILCKPPLIAMNTDPISFTHIIMSDPAACPQPIGSKKLTNTSDQPIEWRIDTGSIAIDASPSSGTLGPGEMVDIDLVFNCDTQESFEARARVTATQDGTPQTMEFRIDATIQQP